MGDITSSNLIKAGIEPDIVVFDQKKLRKEVDSMTRRVIENYLANLVTVENPPGKITSQLWKVVSNSLKSSERVKIKVIGEEDLAVVPFIAEGDSDTVILYGLERKGVLVSVNAELKKKVKELLEKMV